MRTVPLGLLLAALSLNAHADDVKNCPLISTVPLSVAAGPIAVPITSFLEARQCGTAKFDPLASLTVDQPSLVVATMSPAQLVMLAPGPAAGAVTTATARSGKGFGNTVVRYTLPSGELGQLNVTVLP